MCAQIRPLSFNPRSHCSNQPIRAEYKVLELLQPGRVDTDVVHTEIFDRAQSFWMRTDLAKFPVQSVN